MKKYSIVIISKKNREKLKRTLEVLEKNLLVRDDIEKIVVESIDSEDSLIDFGIKYIKIPISNAGFSNQRNIGIVNSSGEYIIFIDDDVEITKDWFNNLVEEFEVRKNDYVGAMGAVFPKKENANFISFCIGVLGHPGGGFRLHYDSQNKILELSQVATCNTIFKKDILLDVGMFNIENKYGSEDSDLSLRIIEKYGKNKFVYIPSALVWHDTHRNLLNMIKWYIRRGKADIDLVLVSKLHYKYVLQTSLLLKFFIFYFLSFINRFIFLSFCIMWYLIQLWRYRFMWKYFEIYNFGNLYKIFTFLLFPFIKFIADVSFDIGRLKEIFEKLKRKYLK